MGELSDARSRLFHYTRPVRVLVNYMLRKETWFVHALADDANTPISPILPVQDQVTLIRLLHYIGARGRGDQRGGQEHWPLVTRQHLDRTGSGAQEPPPHSTAVERAGASGLT